MKKDQSTLIYSPSDLVLFMRSPFASWLERKLIEDPDSLLGKMDEDPMNALLGEKGDAHEATYLQYFQEKHGVERVACIERDYQTAASHTIQAMKDGYEVIFQAYLERDEFRGFADFLVKVPGQSEFGDYYYEVWDTKLAKSTRPYFITQLCCYSWMLEKLQGRLPEEIVVVLGNQKQDRIRIAAHAAYFEQLKSEFLQAQAAFTGDFAEMPDPGLISDYGRWGSYAAEWMKATDSLSIVANIRKSQMMKLQSAGIRTLTDLATTSETRVKGMPEGTFGRLKAQASIQHASRGLDKPLVHVLETDPGKGLSALPPPSSLDVFFDIEGHPLMEGGLEYLWGVSCKNPQTPNGKAYGFQDWWAHDRDQEKRAFEGFIDWVYDRWTQNPGMHVYHYSSYEITAIKKISSREQTRQTQVAELLTHNVFVDLYRIVRTGLLIGEPKYSIKNVEHLYRTQRETEVANGGESVVAYERWRETGGDTLWRERPEGLEAWCHDIAGFNWDVWPELKAIRDYNIDDCESTLELFEWLSLTQKTNQIEYVPWGQDLLLEVERTERQEANAARRTALEALQQGLIQQQQEDPALQNDPDAKFLASLLQFHARERKPKGFEFFQRLQKSAEELIEDDCVLFGESVTTSGLQEGKLQCRLTFSLDQALRKDRFKKPQIWNTNVSVNSVTFEDLDDHRGVVSFAIDPAHESALDQHPLMLLGGEDLINTEILEVGLCNLAEKYFKDRVLPPHLAALMHRDIPHVAQGALPITRKAYPKDEDYMAAIIRAVHSMQDTVLCFQGPPGSGKTYTAQRVIESLVRAGKRVGIMSNSHAAIMNLLKPVAEALPEILVAKIGNYPSDKAFKEQFPELQFPKFRYRGEMAFTKAEPYEAFSVIGATAFKFAKVVGISPMDYLFVDEASQVALANLMVAGGAARNIILMGDQMQLEQPIQGVHPGDAGRSALEYLLGEDAVIPEQKGVFLERTYRMHPSICTPISELVYEGRLSADEANQNQQVHVQRHGKIRKPSGIQTLWIGHEGNTQSSLEEVAAIVNVLHELEGASVTDKEGSSRIIGHEDILVVAPYNMQVNLLKEALPETVRVGTIDKFQGQEAPVVIVSMTVSDIDDSPRGLDFVFDKNRLNVAISRAKALVLLVASPKLLSSSVNSISQMEKVGTFIRFADEGR